ncbi:MAG: ABC transporter permease [Rikenella sp.]|nr:ABC transporter permease [Rikenella sp.]
MKRFWKITKTEFLTIFKDGGLLLILFGALLIYGTLYPTIYAPQVVRDLPVAVVDLDDTPPSRKLIRMLDATPEAAVRYEVQSLDEARRLFLDRKVYGALYIPEGYEKRILAGEQNQVSLYADGGYFLLYSDFMGAVGKVVGTAGAEVQVGRLTAGGLNPRQAAWTARPVAYNVNILYNPYEGYATAILPAVLILIVQQLLLVGIGMAGGTWYERGTWRRFRDYSAVKLVFAKASAYLFLYIPLVLYMFSFQYSFFGYPMRGDHVDLLLIFLPYLLSAIFLGLTLGALFRRRESSMLVLIVSSVFFLIVSGISWPRQGMPEWIYALGRLVPSSSGIDALVRIRTMGGTLTDVAPEAITLWVLTIVYGTTAVLATRRRTHELQCRALVRRQEPADEAAKNTI